MATWKVTEVVSAPDALGNVHMARAKVEITDGSSVWTLEVVHPVRAEATGPIYAYEREGQYVAALLNQTGTIQGQS